MRKTGYANLTVAIALLFLAVILFMSSGFGPGALGSEKRFMVGFQNSLYHLDLAKQQWAEEKHKSELDTPTLQDLAPYLGDWKDTIERFIALGINYRITSMAEPQSDVATLTRNLRFRRGFCRFYPAGTSYGLHAGWAFPQSSTTSSFQALYINNQYLLTATFCVLALGNLLVFEIKKNRNSKQTGTFAHTAAEHK